MDESQLRVVTPSVDTFTIAPDAVWTHEWLSGHQSVLPFSRSFSMAHGTSPPWTLLLGSRIQAADPTSFPKEGCAGWGWGSDQSQTGGEGPGLLMGLGSCSQAATGSLALGDQRGTHPPPAGRRYRTPKDTGEGKVSTF